MTRERRFSGRERQILEALWAKGPSSVADVLAALPDPPGYNAVRRLLSILEEKGAVSHADDGPRYVYSAVPPPTHAAESALSSVVRAFFGGNVERAVATLLRAEDAALDDATLSRLATLIDDARRETADETLSESAAASGGEAF